MIRRWLNRRWQDKRSAEYFAARCETLKHDKEVLLSSLQLETKHREETIHLWSEAKQECAMLHDYALDMDDWLEVVRDMCNIWQETAFAATRDCNAAQERILALELQLAEEKSKTAQPDAQEQSSVEPQEQQYEVLQPPAKPASRTRKPRVRNVEDVTA